MAVILSDNYIDFYLQTTLPLSSFTVSLHKQIIVPVLCAIANL